MESELLNQITRLVISLVLVLQITPWVLILVGLLILKWLDGRGKGRPGTGMPRARR